MKRVINFRGKRPNSGNWVYGSLLVWPDGDTYITELESREFCLTMQNRDVDPATVGQFTGLYDADGCEIYEGDIVKNESAGFFGVIKFKDSAFIIDIDKIKGPLFACLQTGSLEVVGNIHDNPELLKGGCNGSH